MIAKICLNMIVKNEMANLPRCLGALAPHIDCYVICDTGSTDGTDEFIGAFFKARNIPGLIVKSEFRNFAQARNEALKAAKESQLDSDYILFCDADMELQVHRPLYRHELVASTYNVTQITTGSGLKYENIRLVSQALSCTYRGVTHEHLDTGVTPAYLDAISFLDHATGANRGNKFKRDAELLLQGLRDEPQNSRYMFYLANTYFDMGDFELALKYYRVRINMAGWAEEVFYSMYRVGLSLRNLGRHAEMIEQLLLAYQSHPHRAEPLHVLSLYFQRDNKPRLAYHFAEIGLGIPLPKSALFVEPDVYAWRLADICAVSQYYVGKFRESVDLHDRILGLVPDGERARVLKNREWSERALANQVQTAAGV